MEKLNLFVPQWQCSGDTREIHKGAVALKSFIEDLGLYRLNEVEVDLESKITEKNNILGYDIIVKQLRHIQKILNDTNPNKIFTLGGGCGIEVPIVSYFRERHNDIKLFWFDAHGDINSPESSESKHFHGMPLRFIVDKNQDIDDLNINKVSSRNVSLLGTRDLDEQEKIYINKNNINIVSIEDIKCGNIIKSYIRSSDKAYIHIDLDVLDPREYQNVKCPSAGGLSIEDLFSSIKTISRLTNIVGISILESTESDKNKIMKLYDIIKFAIEL